MGIFLPIHFDSCVASSIDGAMVTTAVGDILDEKIRLNSAYNWN